MRAMVPVRNLLAVVLLTACASTPPPPVSGPTTEPMAPWNASPAVAAPQVLLDEWSRAENRDDCAPLTIADPGERARAGTARRANFSGGWGVAWDVPGRPGRDASGHPCATCGRGTFGVAGAGVLPDVAPSPALPHRLHYAGESWAAYGLEGGTGPNWLAQVRVDDQQCLYNVWSYLGREHLEHLLRNLRRVQG